MSQKGIIFFPSTLSTKKVTNSLYSRRFKNHTIYGRERWKLRIFQIRKLEICVSIIAYEIGYA